MFCGVGCAHRMCIGDLLRLTLSDTAQEAFMKLLEESSPLLHSPEQMTRQAFGAAIIAASQMLVCVSVAFVCVCDVCVF